MENISEITQTLTTQLQQKSAGQGNSGCASESKPKSEKSPENGLSERHLLQLWQRMSDIYGHKWVSSYGAVPSDTWAKGLSGITPRQLADGLNACLKRKEDWPPSLPEFRAMCETEKGRYLTAAHRPFPKALPKPRVDPAKVAEHLKTARVALKGKQP